MKIISSAELRNNMKKYLDLAGSETIVIQRGRNETFLLQKRDSIPEIKTLDEIPDIHRAISMDEAIKRVEVGMKKIVKKHKQPKTL